MKEKTKDSNKENHLRKDVIFYKSARKLQAKSSKRKIGAIFKEFSMKYLITILLISILLKGNYSFPNINKRNEGKEKIGNEIKTEYNFNKIKKKNLMFNKLPTSKRSNTTSINTNNTEKKNYNFRKIGSDGNQCSSQLPFYNLTSGECIEYCDINSLVQNLCELKYIYGHALYNTFKGGLTNLDSILLKNLESIKFREIYFSYTIINLELMNNYTYNIITQCLFLLEQNTNLYNNLNDRKIYALMIEHYNENNQVNKTIYEYYCDSDQISTLIKIDSRKCDSLVLTNNTNNTNNNNFDLDATTVLTTNKNEKTIEITTAKELNIYTTNKYTEEKIEVNNKECYESCQTCKKSGNDKVHNCLECKAKYPFQLFKNNNLNCYEYCHNNIYIEKNDTYLCLEEPICLGDKNKLIPGKNNSCIDNCKNDDKYKYEFRNICYESCPKEISSSSKGNPYICELNCTEESPYENIKAQQCINKCDYNDMFNNKCKQNYINKNKDKNEKNGEMSKTIIENIKNGTMKQVLSQVIGNNESLIMKDGESSHIITSLSSSFQRADLSSINFGECEQLIKNKSGLKQEEELILYEIEHNVEGFNIPIIEYVLFNENGSMQLNLSICDNMKVQYYIPLSINETDLSKFDPSSDFYNNECNKASEGGVDMTLYEKKNRFNMNNMSLCEKGCTYKGLDPKNNKVICDCSIKSDMNYNNEQVNIGDLLNQIDSPKSNSNLKVTQCINNLLEVSKMKSNFGFLLLFLILIFFIVILFVYCIKGKRNLVKKIDELIYKKFIKKVELKNNNTNKDGAKANNKIQKTENTNKSRFQKRKSGKIKFSETENNTKAVKGNRNMRNIKNNKNELKNKFNKFNTQGKKLNNKLIINFTIEDIPDKNNDYELNTLEYSLAIKYDKRTCCDYYCSLIRNKQLFLFTFCSFNDYNSGIIKKFIFFLSFAIHYTISALFFNDDNMHQIYEDEGSYNISYQLPKILLSSLGSTVFLRLMLETMLLTDRNVLEVKKQPTKIRAQIMKNKALKCINIKFAFFFITNFILLITFWFYLTCFNGVYENTQVYLIKNTCISFGISLAYPFFWNIFPTALRMCSLSGKKPQKGCIYSTSKFFQVI